MNDTFNETAQCEAPTPTSEPPSVRPEFKVTQHPQGVSIRIDLPGVTPDKLSVTTEKQQLQVKASRGGHTPPEWTLLNQVERPAAYTLRLNLHRDLDLNQIKARFRNGELQIEVAQRAEIQPKQVAIDAAD